MGTTLNFIFTMDEFLKLEPRLKEWFGIDRNNIYVNNIFLQAALEEMKKSNNEGIYKVNGYIDVNAYATEHFEELKDKKLYMEVPYDIYKISDFCNRYGLDEHDDACELLKYSYALTLKEKNELETNVMSDDYYNYEEYVHKIRPEMLRLYLGLHSKDNKETGKRHYHKQCKIFFGGLKAIEVGDWFQVALDRYLEKYLGVNNAKEAERELNTVYGKQVGPKTNLTETKFIWGTYHLLQSMPIFKSKKEKSVTREQGRIIAALLIRLSLIEYKPKESYIDYKDGERIRTKLKYYLTHYDSLDEIIKAQQYKTSPNNKDCLRYY